MEYLGERAEIETLGKRAEFLELLDGEPLHKRDMVEQLDHSRSTVDRAISTLGDAGFVERVTQGFVTTQSGRLAVTRYRSFLAETDAILTNRAVLEPLPPTEDLPASLLTAGDVHETRGSYRLLEAIADAIEDAGGYRAILPRLVDSRHLRMCHARAVRDDLSVSLVAPSALLTRLKTEFPALLGELADVPAFDAAVGETPPYGLLLVEDSSGEPSEVLVVTYADAGIRGFCRSADPETLAWARERFESVRSSATDLSGYQRDGDPVVAAWRPSPATASHAGVRQARRPVREPSVTAVAGGQLPGWPRSTGGPRRTVDRSIRRLGLADRAGDRPATN